MRESQGKTAHQSLQGRFRKALEEKAQCVWSRNHTCIEREGRRLFFPAADYSPKATPAYKDGLPRNSSGRGENLFFSRNHTSMEREGCRLDFLAAD